VIVDLAPSPPHIVGPTWQKTADGRWHLPKRSLGWGILNWLAAFVNTPGGDHAGESFMPTLEQARFILWWYAVDDEGRYTYREGVFRRMKGAGKDPLAAAMALAELCGPVAFSHFDADGDPVGKPRHAAWVQIAAVALDQTKNTFRLFPVMISKKLKETYGLEVNKFIIYSAAGGQIEAVTSAPASMEGNRPTFVIENEIQWWGAGPGGEINEGHAMHEVIEGNVTKIPGSRRLAICNAHIPGYDTVAERAYDHWQDVQSGKAVDTKMLYDALEAPADTPVSEIPSQKENPEGYELGVKKLMEGLSVARGDSYWLPLEDILQSVLDTKNTITESRRKFLNQVNASEDAWIAPYEWDRCQPETPLRPLERGDRIALGFDGSKSGDHTALCACRIEDGALFLIRSWVPEKYQNDEVPREDVDAYVRSTFEKYDVVSFRADVKEFEAYVDQWGRDFKKRIKVNASPNNPIAFDMRGQQKKFAFDCERFLDSVLEREVLHDGNPVLRQHVLNARRHPTNYDAISIRKASKDSSRKIDAAVTAVLAWGARQEFLMSRNNRGRGGAILR
jgi:phage terminase large subunit-like protein